MAECEIDCRDDYNAQKGAIEILEARVKGLQEVVAAKDARILEMAQYCAMNGLADLGVARHRLEWAHDATKAIHEQQIAGGTV